MRFRGTAVLFLLLAVLAGWVYWTDIRGREDREQAAEAAGLALPVEDDEVIEISLVYPDRTIAGTRTDNGWSFVSPEGMEAASAEWDRLATNVGRIERGEVIASEDPDLEGFGLTTPALEVRVRTSDGEEEAILFGNENPAGTDNYVKLDSVGDVFLSPTSWLSLLEVELDTLRDKTVLRFDPDTIQRIDISTDSVSLQKQGASWLLESPLRAAADDTVVQSFLRTLGSARATGFQEEPVNLDTPRLLVTLTSDSGEQHELRISEPDGEPQQYYARDSARDPVFVINSSIVDAAEKSVFEWRDKTLADFERSEITSIVLEALDSRLVLEGQDGDWELAGEGSASATRVSSMLGELEFARASDIIDLPGSPADYGLDAPRLRVVLEGDSGSALRFSFGTETPDNDVYWKADDESVIKVVPRSLFEEFNVTTADLLSTDTAP